MDIYRSIDTHQPRYRFRVKMAAIGSVDDSVDESSALSPDLAAGSWYGTTRSGRRMSFALTVAIVAATVLFEYGN